MITNTQLTEAFGRNLSIVQRQSEGLSHADSLRQPPLRGVRLTRRAVRRLSASRGMRRWPQCS